MRMLRTVVMLFLCLLASASPVSTPAAQEPADPTVERPWARASIGTTRPAAAYLTVVNNGEKAIRLSGAESPVAGRAMIHRTVEEDGVMRMEHAGSVELAAGQSLRLEPGGLHIMLMDLEQSLDEGTTFPLVLRFHDGHAIEVSVPVMGPGARGPEE